MSGVSTHIAICGGELTREEQEKRRDTAIKSGDPLAKDTRKPQATWQLPLRLSLPGTPAFPVPQPFGLRTRDDTSPKIAGPLLLLGDLGQGLDYLMESEGVKRHQLSAKGDRIRRLQEVRSQGHETMVVKLPDRRGGRTHTSAMVRGALPKI